MGSWEVGLMDLGPDLVSDPLSVLLTTMSWLLPWTQSHLLTTVDYILSESILPLSSCFCQVFCPSAMYTGPCPGGRGWKSSVNLRPTWPSTLSNPDQTGQPSEFSSQKSHNRQKQQTTLNKPSTTKWLRQSTSWIGVQIPPNQVLFSWKIKSIFLWLLKTLLFLNCTAQML